MMAFLDTSSDSGGGGGGVLSSGLPKIGFSGGNTLEGILAGRQDKEQEKAFLKMQAYVLLGSVQSAMARINGNTSARAASVLGNLSRLQGVLEGILHSPDSHLHPLELSHLRLDFDTQLFDEAKKYASPAPPALSPAPLEEAIHHHPLMLLLDTQALQLAAVVAAGALLGVHISAMHLAAHHLSCAFMGAFAYRKKYTQARASGKSEQEAEKEAKAAEEETVRNDEEMHEEERKAEKNASTPEERAAIHKQFEDLRNHIIEKADAIRSDLDAGTHEHIDAAYREFIEEPLQTLMAEHARHGAQAKLYLGEEELHAYNADMVARFTQLKNSLDHFHKAAVDACTLNPAALDFETMMKPYIDAVDGTCKTCGQDLSYVNGALQAQQTKTLAARNDLANALAGRCCVSEDTVNEIRRAAQRTGQHVGDICKEIDTFHQRHAIRPVAENPGRLMKSLREKCAALFGKGRAKGAD